MQNKLWEVVGLFYENQGAENSGWVTDALIDQILADVPGLDAAKVKVDAQSTHGRRTRSRPGQAEATKLEVPGHAVVLPRRSASTRPSSSGRGRSTPSEFRPPIDQALQAGGRDAGAGIGALLAAAALSLAIVAGVGRDELARHRPRRRDPAARHRDRGRSARTVTLIQFEDLGCTPLRRRT